MYRCKGCEKEMYSTTEFVERGGDIYCKQCSPQRPESIDGIIRAIREGTGEDARRLIEAANVDINSRGPRGMTLLCYAAGAKGKRTLVEWMIERGADVALGNLNKQTPLHLAAAHGNLETAELLLQSGAPVNALDDQGLTPMDIAEAGHHPEIMILLLSKDGRITLSNR